MGAGFFLGGFFAITSASVLLCSIILGQYLGGLIADGDRVDAVLMLNGGRIDTVLVPMPYIEGSAEVSLILVPPIEGLAEVLSFLSLFRM